MPPVQKFMHGNPFHMVKCEENRKNSHTLKAFLISEFAYHSSLIAVKRNQLR